MPLSNALYNTANVWQTVRCACQLPRGSNNKNERQTEVTDHIKESNEPDHATPLPETTPTPREIHRLSKEVGTLIFDMLI